MRTTTATERRCTQNRTGSLILYHWEQYGNLSEGGHAWAEGGTTSSVGAQGALGGGQ